jgi:DeoR family transcriptional regulator, aga operon transcriptional repressor
MNETTLSKGELRRRRILQLIKMNGRISVQEVVDELGCSEATARRDLDLMEKTESIIRTIGGAMFDGYGPSRETSFSEKKQISWLEKEAIARKAADLITEGDVVGLSGGSTTFLIAKALKERQGITVVTNAVNIAMELSDNDGIQVVVTGGIMRSKSFELCGPLAEKMIDGVHIGKMFIGIDGITTRQGLATYSESEAEVAKRLIARSSETFAVFDHTKVGKTSLFSIAPLASLHACITDAVLEQELAGELNKLGVAVYAAGAGS